MVAQRLVLGLFDFVYCDWIRRAWGGLTDACPQSAQAALLGWIAAWLGRIYDQYSDLDRDLLPVVWRGGGHGA